MPRAVSPRRQRLRRRCWDASANTLFWLLVVAHRVGADHLLSGGACFPGRHRNRREARGHALTARSRLRLEANAVAALRDKTFFFRAIRN